MWRSVAEVVVGLIYAIGAIFNTVYTLRHAEDFYGDFADGAWLRPAGAFVRDRVVPHGGAFTLALIIIQVAIAVAILSRGSLVVPALVVGGVFALTVAFFSSPGGAIGNLALATIQFALALARL